MSGPHDDRPSVPWPSPIAPDALRGLAGEFVAIVEPHSESSREALLVQFLAGFGSIVGRSAFFRVEATRHHGNLFVALVGKTARARKGTSWGYVSKLFEQVDPEWARDRVRFGLSSGEGLIHAVRDADDVKGDAGVDDKRFCAFESELAQVFKVFRRESNTLSTTLRAAWDGGSLGTLAKNCGEVATNPHVSMIGHITKAELLRCVAQVELLNGLANRILWVCVERSKLRPWGAVRLDDELAALASRVREAVDRARCAGGLVFAQDARPSWEQAYADLSTSVAGAAEGVVSRAEAQVVRLALLYALLDGDNVIQRAHLDAAFAVWRYCEASAHHIFGESTGDKRADRILAALRRTPGGMTLTEVHGLFSNNLKSEELTAALFHLRDLGWVEVDQSRSAQGRPRIAWRLKRTNETMETNTDARCSRSTEDSSSSPFSSSKPEQGAA